MTATDPRQEGATPVAFLPGLDVPPVAQGKPAGGTHAFVDDEPFGPYCADCGLPQGNWRHGPSLLCHVMGEPAPQGSKRHVGRGIMVESSKKVRPWREAVKAAAFASLPSPEVPLFPRGTPVYAHLIFQFVRPKSHYRTGKNAHLLREGAPAAPVGKPDVDKVQRSTFDALVDVGVLAGDEQVTKVVAEKVWAQRAGAVICLQVAS